MKVANKYLLEVALVGYMSMEVVASVATVRMAKVEYL